MDSTHTRGLEASLKRLMSSLNGITEGLMELSELDELESPEDAFCEKIAN